LPVARRTVRTRFQERRRAHALGGAARSGRFARRKVWDVIRSYLRAEWRFILPVAILLPGVTIPLTVLRLDGAAESIVIGFTFASGLWAATLVTILYSGAAGLVMAIVSEHRTADVLRTFEREGWRLVNGLTLREKADIDHIAIGPPGVLVVETKWTSGGAVEDVWIRNRDRWRKQVFDARKTVSAHFKRALGDAPVHMVIVVWLPDGVEPEIDRLEQESITIVHGQALRQWIRSLDSAAMTPDHVDLLWQAIAKHASDRDAKDRERSRPPVMTLSQGARRLVLEPYVGFMACVLTIGLSTQSDDVALFIATLLAVIAAGFWAYKNRRLRSAAVGWLAAAGTVCVGTAAVILVELV